MNEKIKNFFVKVGKGIVWIAKKTGKGIIIGMKALANYQLETYKKWDKEFEEEKKKKGKV
jgi:lysophospholipid acyltransferase (LPLAT)-like uncharacterized protein